MPLAKDGLLDLRDWSFSAKGSVQLNGQWEFYWRTRPEATWLTSQNLIDQGVRGSTVNVPGYWNDGSTDGLKYSEDGYATYRLTVLVSTRDELALKFLSVGTAYTLWIDGREMLTVGHPGTSEASTTPEYAPQIVRFRPTSSRVDIRIYVSNYHHRNAGLWEVIKLGLPQDLVAQRMSRVASDLLLFGAILMMGIYNLCMWVVRREFGFGLFLGCFCLLLGIRILLVDERYINELIPGLGWEFLTRLEYFCWFVAIPVFLSFLRTLFPAEVPSIVERIVWGIGLTSAVACLLLDIKLATQLVPYYQVFTIIGMAYGIYIVVASIYQRREGAIIMGIGCTMLFAAAVNDILVNNAFFDSSLQLPLGLFLFVLSQSVLVSIRYARTTRTLDQRSNELLNTTIKLHTQEKLRLAAEGKSHELAKLVNQSSQLSSLAILARRALRQLELVEQPPNRAHAILERLVALVDETLPRSSSTISSVFASFEHSVGYQELKGSYPEKSINVRCDEGREKIDVSRHDLFTLLDSLVHYAVTAYEGEQVVTLKGQKLWSESRRLIHHEVLEGNYFVISIEDKITKRRAGEGIALADLLEALDAMPRFDAVGEHRHLHDLAVVWAIVEETDCAVNQETSGDVVRFDFFFPLSVERKVEDSEEASVAEAGI